jgi:hypothetical protein
MNDGIKTQERQEPRSALHLLQIVTTMDACYEFPDMLDEHLQELLENLENPTEKIVIRNVSDVVLVIPFRIISRVEIVEGARGRDGEDEINVIWRREAS